MSDPHTRETDDGGESQETIQVQAGLDFVAGEELRQERRGLAADRQEGFRGAIGIVRRGAGCGPVSRMDCWAEAAGGREDMATKLCSALLHGHLVKNQ